MRFSKHGWLFAVGLSAVSVSSTCSGQTGDVPPAPTPDAKAASVDTNVSDKERMKAAADQAEVSGKAASESAQRASNGALTAEANAASKTALCAEQEAKIAADVAFASTPNDPDATTKAQAAGAAAKKAMDASKKALAAHKAAADALAPGVQKAEQAKADEQLGAELRGVIEAELDVAMDTSVSANDRISAIEVLGAIAIAHGELKYDPRNQTGTISSHIVNKLTMDFGVKPVSIAKYQVLSDVLSASGKHIVAGDEAAFQLVIHEFYRSIQHDEIAIQYVSSTALAEVLAHASIDADEYLARDFPELVKSVKDTISIHKNSHVRLGLLTVLSNKGNAILNQQQDVASAAAERELAKELEKSLKAATDTLKAANEAVAKAQKPVDEANATINQLNADILAIDTAIATFEAARSLEAAKEMPDEAKIMAFDKKIADAGEQKDVSIKARGNITSLRDNDLIPAKTKADETQKTAMESQKVAKAKFDAAEAAADSKSKAKPVAEGALSEILAALRELSSQSAPVDRVSVEARFALTTLLKGELLPDAKKLTFAAGPMPNDRQPLAASDRPTAGMMNSERMGVTHTRSFDPAQDVTNRSDRGSRVAAPPQSLRVPRPDYKFPKDPREIRKAAGAIKVEGPAFVPGTKPNAATPAGPVAAPSSSSSGGESSGSGG
ncbi:MAG: hypothetical protein JNM43_11240 [Planctomycetaceae bacterium]|nr:hypothetical protein [Planctomycetaceae bacterium]